MKGWVYVISNKAMPGLMKIGHSSKDPMLRAQELDNTGSPHPYFVEYEMLIEDPASVELLAHRLLSQVREGREWFKCSCEEAIAAIQQVAGGQAITESFKRADRVRAEQIRREKEAEQAREKWLSRKQDEEMSRVRAEWDKYMADRFRSTPFWPYWVGCSIFAGVLLAHFFPKLPVEGGWFWSGTLGAVAAAFVRTFWEDRRKESPEYKETIEDRAKQFQEALERVSIICPNESCKQRLWLGVKDLRACGNVLWTCSKCKTDYDPWAI